MYIKRCKDLGGMKINVWAELMSQGRGREIK
jgi:hypothetical protein